MRSLAAIAFTASFFITSAYAATDVAPLAPGKPAGVQRAQVERNTLMVVLGVGIVAAGIALTVSGDSNTITPAVATTTATTTGTTTS